jgi:hypothetical protein
VIVFRIIEGWVRNIFLPNNPYIQHRVQPYMSDASSL